MKSIILYLAIPLVVIAIPSCLFGQGETAVPFLSISSSPSGNGMGGITSSIFTDEPMAVVANPAHLGVQSMRQYIGAATYVPKTAWLSGDRQTYGAMAINAGINLQCYLSWLSIPVGVGIGYSRIDFNYAAMTVTSGTGAPNTFEPFEKSDNVTLALGAEYYVKIGVGYTVKNIESFLSSFNVQNQFRSADAKVSAHDWGVIAQLPVIDVISKTTSKGLLIFPKTEPLLDVTFGYARRNLSDAPVVYINAAQQDPLPRTASLGMSWKIGLTTHTPRADWEVLSFTLAREAEDILVRRFPALRDSSSNIVIRQAGWEYVDGTGDIRFFKNVILGEWNSDINLRKGWQVNLAEILCVRGGSFQGPRQQSYRTSGFGIQLSGMLKLLEWMSPEILSHDGFVDFVSHHVDIRYNRSDYGSSLSQTDPVNLLAGASFQGISVTVR